MQQQAAEDQARDAEGLPLAPIQEEEDESSLSESASDAFSASTQGRSTGAVESVHVLTDM
jgi:hypothetical protein